MSETGYEILMKKKEEKKQDLKKEVEKIKKEREKKDKEYNDIKYLPISNDEFRFFKFCHRSINQEQLFNCRFNFGSTFIGINESVGSMRDKVSRQLGLNKYKCSMVLVVIDSRNKQNVYYVDETASIAEFLSLHIHNSNEYLFVIDEIDKNDLYSFCTGFFFYELASWQEMRFV